jgi:hypothetical protein
MHKTGDSPTNKLAQTFCPLIERIMWRNNQAFSHRTVSAAEHSAADYVFSLQKFERVFDGTLAISVTLKPFAVRDDVSDSGPHKPLAGVVSLRLQFEIADNFSDDSFAMSFVGALGVGCSELARD